MRERENVVQALRAQLHLPQRSPVKIRLRAPFACEWRAGELIAFHSASEKTYALHMYGTIPGRYGALIIAVFDIDFADVDHVSEETPLMKLGSKGFPDTSYVLVLTNKELRSGRFRRLERSILLPSEKPDARLYVTVRQLDDDLAAHVT
jgi:hypothetical protein